IAEQIGLDASEIGKFKYWTDTMLAGQFTPQTKDSIQKVIEVELELQHYLHGMFEARRAKPRGDLISTLVHAEFEGGDRLDEQELQSLLKILILGGFDTTTNALAHAVWALIRFPDLQERLHVDPDQIERFIEESLRFESPTQGLVRRVTRDVDISGTVV